MHTNSFVAVSRPPSRTSGEVELDNLGQTFTSRSQEADARAVNEAELEARVGEVNEGEQEQAQLPPVDRGKDAYMFLAAAFVVEALVWGECVSSLHSFQSPDLYVFQE